MRTIILLCVGKIKEKYFREACAEYEKRLSAFCKFQIVEVAEARVPENPSEAEIAKALASEGKDLLAKIPAGAVPVALCVEGEELSSEALSAKMSRWAVDGTGKLAFIIGSSHGLSPEVKAAARLRLSMSRMTLPHTLARVMLCEQIYRACSIEAGTKYHK